MKTTVVTTTVRVPTFLTSYAESVCNNGHEDVNFIVVGDRKSDPMSRYFCSQIPDCEFMNLDDQNLYLWRFPRLSNHLPVDSVSRRNIGILKAYEQGAEVIITLDDDNFLADPDPIYGHSIVGRTLFMPAFKSHSGWFNPCGQLVEENNIKFYHRGYSPKNRWNEQFKTLHYRWCKVVVNAGMWLGNPDVDAITRLERPLNVTGMSPILTATNFGLEPGTWSPFNCQNTALARKVIPAYFMSPYIGRHDDIFASYVVTRLAEHFGDVVTFGAPLSNHQRSPHDLWQDLDRERWGMPNTDFFCDTLRKMTLTTNTYHEGFGQIIEQLSPLVWNHFNDNKFLNMLEGMKIWHDVFKEIL